MSELDDSLQRMSFAQLALLMGFATAYTLALGTLLGGRARARAAVLALALAAGFVALSEPWVHGALLAAFAVAAIGVFAGASWLLARLVTRRAEPAPALPLPDGESPEVVAVHRRRLPGVARRVNP